ncbi:sensor histidine kinase KdpD [Erysipelothrix urinaevulpis]|uniref:sensor histidine kinase n=1 Tax=Erysipelothrix urinaevulpis TaxID=2683717 RepID=UPI0013583470|nr:HAMP domain-containing sensor histidine kinase [Erysipelothrix urinaevulpis]
MTYDNDQNNLFKSLTILYLFALVAIGFMPVFIIILGLFIGTLLMIIRYFKKRKENIDKLHIYLQKLNQGNYNYDLLAYEEGELARIHSELNKTTVNMRTMNERLKDQKELLAHQFQDVSHQLKTPLAALMLLNDLQEETEITENIHAQIERMRSLVESLITLIKADAQLLPFCPEWVQTKHILDQVLDNLSIHLKEKKLIVRVSGGEKKIFVDSKLMFEVLYNIINNKLDYAQEVIMIEVEQKGPWTTIRISDDGDAICHPQKVFDRFYTYPSKTESLGIGLAYAKSVLDLHHATIRVEEKNTFVIELDHVTKL